MSDSGAGRADDRYGRWAEDAAVLGQIGRALFTQPTRITVRLPAGLASQALRSWEREDIEGGLPAESWEQKATRHRAATLALIGLAIHNKQRPPATR